MVLYIQRALSPNYKKYKKFSKVGKIKHKMVIKIKKNLNSFILKFFRFYLNFIYL